MAKGDIFLQLESARAGAVRGESNDTKYRNAIDVIAWSWGMDQAQSMGAAGAAKGRRTLDAITIVKNADASSTALMSCLSANEAVKKAVLTVRKASGAEALDYLRITIEKGRIASIKLESDPSNPQEVLERITLTYQQIKIEYTNQSEKGGSNATSTFTDSIDVA